MFAWNCAEAGGSHLGTCVDRFYFGSCCKLPEVIKPADLDQMNQAGINIFHNLFINPDKEIQIVYRFSLVLCYLLQEPL